MPSLAHDAVAIPFAATIRAASAQGSAKAWAPATAATSATVAARWRVTASDPTAPTMSPTSRSTFTKAKDHTMAAPRSRRLTSTPAGSQRAGSGSR